jgi:hypothetical protein
MGLGAILFDKAFRSTFFPNTQAVVDKHPISGCTYLISKYIEWSIVYLVDWPTIQV